MKKNYYTLFCRLSVFCLVGFYLLFVSIKTFGDSNPPESNIIVCDACGNDPCNCECKGNDHNKNCKKHACGKHMACVAGNHEKAECNAHFACIKDEFVHEICNFEIPGMKPCTLPRCHEHTHAYSTCPRCNTPTEALHTELRCPNGNSNCSCGITVCPLDANKKCTFCKGGCGSKQGNCAACTKGGGCTKLICQQCLHCPVCNKANTTHKKCGARDCNFYQCEKDHGHVECRGGCGKNGDCSTKCKNSPSCSRLMCEPGATHVKQACGRHNECEECRCKKDDNDHGHGHGHGGNGNSPDFSSEEDSIPPVVNRGLSVRLIINDNESFPDHEVKAQMNVKKNGKHYYATGLKGCSGHSNVSMILAEGDYEIEFSVIGKCGCNTGYHQFVPEFEIGNLLGQNYGYVVKEMSPANGTAMSNTTKVLCRLSVFKIDLQIDSNNDEIIDEEDDKVEEGIDNSKIPAENVPGHIVICNHGDMDKDKIPDYADNEISGNELFSEVKVELKGFKECIEKGLEDPTVTFTFPSVPWVTKNAEGKYPLPDTGAIRLWTKKSSKKRDPAADLIKSGKAYTWEEIKKMFGPEFVKSGKKSLYVEGFMASFDFIELKIKGSKSALNISDKVLFSTIEVDNFLVVHDKTFEKDYCGLDYIRQSKVMNNKLTVKTFTDQIICRLFNGKQLIVDSTPFDGSGCYFDTTVDTMSESVVTYKYADTGNTLKCAKTDSNGAVYINGTLLEKIGTDFKIKFYAKNEPDKEIGFVKVKIVPLIRDFSIGSDGDKIDEVSEANDEDQGKYNILKDPQETFNPLSAVFDITTGISGEYFGMELEYDLDDDCEMCLDEDGELGILKLENLITMSGGTATVPNGQRGDCIKAYVIGLKDGNNSEKLKEGIVNHEVKFEGFNCSLKSKGLDTEVADKVVMNLDVANDKEAIYTDNGAIKGLSPSLLMKEGKYKMTFGLAPKGDKKQKHLIEIDFDVDYQLNWK